MSAEQDLANANVQIANLISEVTRFRDAAMGINNIWPTITEGRQNTADGKYFSVPGSGTYMRLYRRAGTSQTLIAEFPDRAQVQALVDTLGGRGVVGGSGDLMAVGAFGIGSLRLSKASYGNDINNLAGKTGVYEVAVDTLGRPNIAPSNFAGYLMQIDNTSVIYGTFPSSMQDRVLGRNNLGFDWYEFYTNKNILGTVSHSGGVPTGAIIEYISNANGQAQRFAGGLQIATNAGNPITTNPATFVGAVTSIDGNRLRIGRWY